MSASMIEFSKELEPVKKACEKYGFSCHESINGVFIRTKSLAGWFILLTEGKPRLMHENYRHRQKYGNGIMEGYHEHTEVREDTPAGMVEYIMAHDKAMAKKKPKTVFDNLNASTYKKGKKDRRPHPTH